MWAEGFPSSPGGKVWEGTVPPLQKSFEFSALNHFKWHNYSGAFWRVVINLEDYAITRSKTCFPDVHYIKLHVH